MSLSNTDPAARHLEPDALPADSAADSQSGTTVDYDPPTVLIGQLQTERFNVESIRASAERRGVDTPRGVNDSRIARPQDFGTQIRRLSVPPPPVTNRPALPAFTRILGALLMLLALVATLLILSI